MISIAQDDDFNEIREIFWVTSGKSLFESDLEKKKFEYKYLGYYFENARELFLIYKEKNVLGYICSVQDITKHPFLLNSSDYHKYFQSHYDKYPSELHINMHPKSQGMGLGSKLINALLLKLSGSTIHGSFLITDSSSRNVNFYEKNGYITVAGHNNIVMLGKTL